MKYIFIIIFIASGFFSLNAQKIKDGETLEIDGLIVTFHIMNKETRTVRGNTFERYKVSADVKNNTGKSFNIRLGTTSQDVDNAGLIELNCRNATGARLTSKRINMGLRPHKINVTYWTHNKEGKLVTSVMSVVAGYYLDQGDMVNDEAIFIVPEGQEPDVFIRKLQ
jgi:hypothetical protein